MKIKADFITNSSSTMFVIEIDNKFLRKDLEKLMSLHVGESLRFFDDRSKLISYTQHQPCDWVTEITGRPIATWNMDSCCFDVACNILKEGKFVIYLTMERNYPDHMERALRIIEDNGGIIKHRDYD